MRQAEVRRGKREKKGKEGGGAARQGDQHRGKNRKLQLRTTSTFQLPASDIATVPTRWVKFIVGLFLLPVAWLLTQTFFGVFAWVTVERAFWLSEPFWFFMLGAIIWCGAFFGLPRPLWIYVFGHELTHVIWVWLMGGRVSGFRVSRKGGHIMTDKVNTWIALAPYFFPIYSALVVLGYYGAGLFVDMAPYSRWLFAAIGFTWAFHFTFTCWMIPKGQTDLAYGGHFFSLVIIYIVNLVVLSILLVLATPDVSWRLYLVEFLHNAIDFSSMVTVILRNIR